MDLRLLAISDTHIGEDSSLLSFPAGRQELWRALRSAFSNLDPATNNRSDRFTVDEFVMIGDICDRTLSSTSEIQTHTNAFIETLGSAACIKKLVYVPGNHDHTIWTDWAVSRHGEYTWTTRPQGEQVVVDAAPVDPDGDRALLELFFGYPYGGSWRSISGFDIPPERKGEQKPPDFKFVVANPLYATEIDGSTYAFAHGTHFRGMDVCRPLVEKRWANGILGRPARWWLGLDIDTNCDPMRARDMEELEAEVQPFVDSLWPSPGNERVSASDHLYYLMCTVAGSGAKRQTPASSRLFRRDEFADIPGKRLRRLTPDGGKAHESIACWQRFFSRHMLAHLQGNHLSTDDLVFVYGDTHTGGWGDVSRPEGKPIRFYNTGVWIADHEKNHPPCQLFAVDYEGHEYLLDVTYREVEVTGEPILRLVSDAAEHRYRGGGRIAKFLAKIIAG